MGRTSPLIALLLLAPACSDPISPAGDGGVTDAPGGPDADLVSYRFTGLYLDWDSTEAAPCPIVGATWTAHYDDTRVGTTDDTGEFTLRLASYLAELDVEQPELPSSCTTPQSRYEIPAIAIVPPAVGYAGGQFVARSLTTARATTFYATFGSAFDPTRGTLYVHVEGASRTVSISSPHAPVQAFNGTAWAGGSTGSDVLFPNIPLTSETPMTTVTVQGGAIGTGSVPLVAGKITYLTVIAK